MTTTKTTDIDTTLLGADPERASAIRPLLEGAGAVQSWRRDDEHVAIAYNRVRDRDVAYLGLPGSDDFRKLLRPMHLKDAPPGRKMVMPCLLLRCKPEPPTLTAIDPRMVAVGDFVKAGIVPLPTRIKNIEELTSPYPYGLGHDHLTFVRDGAEVTLRMPFSFTRGRTGHAEVGRSGTTASIERTRALANLLLDVCRLGEAINALPSTEPALGEDA